MWAIIKKYCRIQPEGLLCDAERDLLATAKFLVLIHEVLWEVVTVTSFLKKHSLNATDPASYRPISNLNTVSKILEQLVLNRVIPHVLSSSRFDAVQSASAYRRHHSTETALLKITNDIYSGFDAHQSAIFVALGQSAAFDCIDPKIMISRLQHTFVVTNQALNWFVSYFDAMQVDVHAPIWHLIRDDCL